ncbi:ATP-binding cassette sub-family C member 2-like [Rhipicephalus microplus]|uniref:ATP-binding cassette sub-family C member 2-like n=1 Tax=Rhipicephalus microplus TaxID=6941 RepID=UPI003F6D80E0
MVGLTAPSRAAHVASMNIISRSVPCQIVPRAKFLIADFSRLAPCVSLGAHNTLSEISEAQRAPQLSCLSSTAAGRRPLDRAGLLPPGERVGTGPYGELEEQALLSYKTARKIIVYPLPKNTDPERDEGRLLLKANTRLEVTTITALLLASCAAEFLTGSFESTCAYALAVRVRALLQGSIFTKMMRMSPATLPRYPAGYMVSIVGVDCGVITTTFTVVTRIFFSILFTPVMYYVLWVRVGTIPVLCCVSWHIFVTLLLIPATKLQRKLWGRVIKCRDARLKKVTDILSSIRLVKYYAWEETFADSLTQLRSPEVNHVFRLNLTDGLLDSLFVSTSSVLAIILFGTWALFNPGKELTASLSFSCIYALSLLDPSCSNIVGMFRLVVLDPAAKKKRVEQTLMQRVQVPGETCTTYIEKVLKLRKALDPWMTEEDKDATKVCVPNARAHHRIDTGSTHPIRQKPYRVAASEHKVISEQVEGSIWLDECSFTWSNAEAFSGATAEAALRDVSLKVEPGCLVGIVGSVGSGKSTLLSSLQGDVQKISGHFRVTGTIACVPQSACIYNMSIRDNILFGKPYDASLCNRVLSACDLLKDMTGFPAGNLTEVGQKIVIMEKAQKAKLFMAIRMSWDR